MLLFILSSCIPTSNTTNVVMRGHTGLEGPIAYKINNPSEFIVNGNLKTAGCLVSDREIVKLAGYCAPNNTIIEITSLDMKPAQITCPCQNGRYICESVKFPGNLTNKLEPKINVKNLTFENSSSIQNARIKICDNHLKTSISVNDTDPTEGDLLTYNISSFNKGPGNITGLVITSLLPAEVAYVSYTANKGTYDPISGKWYIGNLENNQNASLEISVKVGTNLINNIIIASISEIKLDQEDISKDETLEAKSIVRTMTAHFKSISSGAWHTCGVTTAGDVFCWGANWYGQLGDGASNVDQDKPVKIDLTNLDVGEKIAKIFLGSSSEHHSCAISTKGRAFCWGSELHGMLGNNRNSSMQNKPVLVDSSNLFLNESFLKLDLGEEHTCGVTNLGNMYCWGRDNNGQLGNGVISTDQLKPVLVDTSNLVAGEKYKDLTVGYNFSCGLTSFNNVLCWGRDVVRELGNGVITGNQAIPGFIDSSNLATGEKFIKLSAGGWHSCGLTNLGNTYCWGAKSGGVLGDGSPIIGWGVFSDKPTIIDSSSMLPGEKFNDLSLGWEHSCGTTNLGNSYCWGWDTDGALGDGAVIAGQSKPTLIDQTNLPADDKLKYLASGGYRGCGLSFKGDTYCWGNDDTAESIGDGSGSVNQPIPILINGVNVNSNEKFSSVTLAYFDHGCGLTTKSRTFCWGANWGYLGIGTSTNEESKPVQIDRTNLSNDEYFIKISLGGYHSCGITNKGRTFCWGDNGNGKLGDGGIVSEVDKPILIDRSNLNTSEYFQEIGSTSSSTCGITNEARTFCWGSNSSGSLGIGSIGGSQNKPTLIDSSNLNLGEKFIFLSTGGGQHICGVTNEHRALCWGDNTYGQLGFSSIGNSVSLPTLITSTKMLAGEKYKFISAGGLHSCGVTFHGNSYCWGRHNYGQLGAGGAVTGTSITPFLVDNSNLQPKETFISISLGDVSACGSTNLGNSYCWGANWSGQLGIGGGSPVNQFIPALVDTNNLLSNEALYGPVQGSEQFSCSLSNLGNLYCWGANWGGMLGDGTLLDSMLPKNKVNESAF